MRAIPPTTPPTAPPMTAALVPLPPPPVGSEMLLVDDMDAKRVEVKMTTEGEVIGPGSVMGLVVELLIGVMIERLGLVVEPSLKAKIWVARKK